MSSYYIFVFPILKLEVVGFEIGASETSSKTTSVVCKAVFSQVLSADTFEVESSSTDGGNVVKNVMAVLSFGCRWFSTGVVLAHPRQRRRRAGISTQSR